MRLRDSSLAETPIATEQHRGNSEASDHFEADAPAEAVSDRDPLEYHSDAGPHDNGGERTQLLRRWSPRVGSAQAAPDTSRYARQLRSVLSSLAKGRTVQRAAQRVVVTGVDTGVEASKLACGLAATCAASGYRALLVDANLDHPWVHRHFNLPNVDGLSSLLASAGSPHRLPQSTAVPNLAVITAGPKAVNYSSLLARERVFHRLDPIARHFDYIVIDAGTLPASLAGRISAGADNVLVAVKEHVSSVHQLELMIRTLQAEAVPDPAVLIIE